ncbi:MAG: hypothetical protein Q8R47_05830 [Nanoarchaeota archaeon]|nr:hypothetical protein [Nanoarchaeota archaeon]
MPYLKFASQKEREKAFDIELRLAEENGGKPQGLVAVMNDPKHGVINFYSKAPYLMAFENNGLEYQIIEKEQISAPYAEVLRELHPDFSDEL